MIHARKTGFGQVKRKNEKSHPAPEGAESVAFSAFRAHKEPPTVP